MKKILPASLLIVLLTFSSACGYTISSSPYGLEEPLILNVRVVINPTRFPELGPMMTRDIIARLDSSPNIRVQTTAPSTLKVSIKNLKIEGGSWDVKDDSDVPEASVSRVLYMEIEAILEKTEQDGKFYRNREIFNSQYTYIVSEDQSRSDMRREEAFKWMTNDLAQKITQGLLSEF